MGVARSDPDMIWQIWACRGPFVTSGIPCNFTGILAELRPSLHRNSAGGGPTSGARGRPKSTSRNWTTVGATREKSCEGRPILRLQSPSASRMTLAHGRRARFRAGGTNLCPRARGSHVGTRFRTALPPGARSRPHRLQGERADGAWTLRVTKARGDAPVELSVQRGAEDLLASRVSWAWSMGRPEVVRNLHCPFWRKLRFPMGQCDQIGCVAARSVMLMLPQSTSRRVARCPWGSVGVSIGMRQISSGALRRAGAETTLDIEVTRCYSMSVPEQSPCRFLGCRPMFAQLRPRLPKSGRVRFRVEVVPKPKAYPT